MIIDNFGRRLFGALEAALSLSPGLSACLRPRRAVPVNQAPGQPDTSATQGTTGLLLLRQCHVNGTAQPHHNAPYFALSLEVGVNTDGM